MYKTIIIIIIIIIIRGPIIIGLSNCPALHTHAQMRIKAKVYCSQSPHLRTVGITSFSSSGRLADSRAPCPHAGNLRPSTLFWGGVYFESYETERNAESEVYSDL